MSYSVVGAGRSGIAAANMLAGRGHDVMLFESRSDVPRPEDLDDRVAFEAGSHAVRIGDTAVLSPGIPEVSPVRAEIAARAARVIGEIELFFEFCPAPILAITGTDGKSTTTTMLGDIVAAAGHHAIVGGNLGNPLTGELGQISPESVVVAEISCFQLTTCVAFRPRVALVTNIAEDHTDYHGSFEGYQAAKRRIWASMTDEDVVILNADDPFIQAWLARGLGPKGPRIMRYSLASAAADAYATDDALFVRVAAADAPLPFMRRDELPLIGVHNVMNALAAAQMAVAWGIDPRDCRKGLMAYKPLPHRLNRVAVLDGVAWINDSKATNPNAAMAGIRAITGSFIALVGGSSKDAHFDELADTLNARARAVICFGQTRDTLKAALANHPDCTVVETMQDAMHRARANARPHETVLLSPACASFDAFKGYAHRGEVFEETVRGWIEPKAQ